MPAMQLRNLLRANAKRGEFRAEADAIYVYGPIVSDDFDAEWLGGVSMGQFAEALAQRSGDVKIRINSPGGDVFAGVAIAQHMREYNKGSITVQVDGYAASIASIVAIAAPKVVMAPGSMMMIHKAWSIAIGNADDMLELAGLLEKIDGTLAESYAARGEKTADEFLALMQAETWFTAQEAIDAGLADELAASAQAAKAKAAAWDFSAYLRAPAAAAAAPAVPAEAPAADPANNAAAIAAQQIEQSAKRTREHAARMLVRPA